MHLIINPFTRIAGVPSLSFGTLFLLIGAMISGFFNARFDGVLDLHFGNSTNFSQPLTDQLLVWATLVFVFYPLSLIMGSKPRFIDIVGTFALSRLPFTFIPLINCTGFMSEISGKLKTMDMQHPGLPFSGTDMGIFIMLTIILLAFAIWLVALYFNAYKTCSNLKGNRLIVSFIVGLLISEVISVYLTRSLF